MAALLNRCGSALARDTTRRAADPRAAVLPALLGAKVAPLAALLPALLGACTPMPESGETVPRPGNMSAATADVLVPTGHGSLRQDEFTIQLQSGALLVRVTPLAEEIIRLAAPDTYQRLNALAQSHRAEVEAVTGSEPLSLFLISFFSYEPDVSYEPESLQLEHRGGLLRPRAILPVTPGFGRQRLKQREARSAVYVFADRMDLSLPLTVRYEFERSDAWDQILPRLESERARVRARTGG